MNELCNINNDICSKLPKCYTLNDTHELNTLYKSCDKINICHLNIRGIRTNFDEFSVIFNELKFKIDIIILTESHLQYNEPYSLPGYTTHFFNSRHTKYDGLVIFVKNDTIINAAVEAEKVLCTANAARISFTLDQETYSVVAAYRSPSTNIGCVIKELEALVP